MSDTPPALHDLQKRLIIAEATVHAKEAEVTSLRNRLLTSSFDGIVMTDPRMPDNPITYVNPVFERLTGYTAAEVKGKNCQFLQGTDRKQPELGEVRKAIKEKRECRVTIKNYKKDGTLFWNQLSITPVFDNQGNLTSYIGVIHDVTKEKEVDRMKTEFISLASHQLRTPLSAMKWFCELLLSGDAGALNYEQREYIQNISFSNDRMINLVGDLLNISRIESGRVKVDSRPTDLRVLIQEVLKELTIKANKKNIQISTEAKTVIPLINIDPDLVREVYANLISNSIKYTPSNGKIWITLGIQGNNLLSEVSDNGYGIPQKDRDRVFQKFYRGGNVVSVVTDGTGLGLYLVKAIVESSGGKIWFNSIESKGTSFYFSLPLLGMKAKPGEVTLTPG